MTNRPYVFKNRHFVKRNYDYTNRVACIATENPDRENWEMTDGEIIEGLQYLSTENGVMFFGYA